MCLKFSVWDVKREFEADVVNSLIDNGMTPSSSEISEDKIIWLLNMKINGVFFVGFLNPHIDLEKWVNILYKNWERINIVPPIIQVEIERKCSMVECGFNWFIRDRRINTLPIEVL